MSGTPLEEKRNLDVIRRTLEAFATADVEALRNAFAPNAYYHFAPLGVLGGEYRGIEAVLGLFGQLDHETESTFRVAAIEISASGDRVFMLYRATATRNGKTLDRASLLPILSNRRKSRQNDRGDVQSVAM